MAKKVLLIEDNYMVRNVLKKSIEQSGLQLDAFSNGVEALDFLKSSSTQYDLILSDLEMPEMDGFQFVEEIKKLTHLKKPYVMMLSANEKDDVILQALMLGVDEYIKKPVSTQILIHKIYKALEIDAQEIKDVSNSIINKNLVGIVIPCYNEEKRLDTNEFKEFVIKNSSYHLCFVNDGSKDGTIDVLNKFKTGNENYISIVDLKQNSGKSEAVRQGILYMLENHNMDYIGFLDADLSTDFMDFETMITEISKKEYIAVIGSRISRIGANINKESNRAFISKLINLMIQNIVKMPFKDTQCGAKLFTTSICKDVFDKPFISRWLFDVEILIRIRKKMGLTQSYNLICEMPLKKWIHKDMSKLKFSDSIKIFSELLRIKLKY